jgi:hypothetical protein
MMQNIVASDLHQYHKAVEIVEAFLATEFEGGRHQNRVNKMSISSFINKIWASLLIVASWVLNSTLLF